MVAVTYGVAPAAETVAKTSAPAVTEAAAPRKPWYVRLMNAMIESRMRQARREITMHRRLMHDTFDEYGSRALTSKSDELPFGGW
jgi:hypothetical protein